MEIIEFESSRESNHLRSLKGRLLIADALLRAIKIQKGKSNPEEIAYFKRLGKVAEKIAQEMPKYLRREFLVASREIGNLEAGLNDPSELEEVIVTLRKLFADMQRRNKNSDEGVLIASEQ